MSKEKKQENEQTKVTESDLTEEEQSELMRLQEQIKAIKNKNKFEPHYYAIRKGTVAINKSDKTDSEKKQALVELCKETIQKIEAA